MERHRQIAINEDKPISAWKVFAGIYVVMVVIMVPLWMLAVHFASEQSRTFVAKLLFLIVGAGFLVALKFLGLDRQFEIGFGVLAVLVNAFVYASVIWFFTMAAKMMRVA